MLLARLLAAVGAGALGFSVAAILLLWHGPAEGLVFFGLFVAIPAAGAALLPFGARVFCLALGLLASVGTAFMDFGGPDSPMLVVPLAANCLAAAAVIAEIATRAVRFLVTLRSGEGEA